MPNLNHSWTLNGWIQQKDLRIRVITNGAPGFGNQAACVNAIGYLRQMGFSGIIELIYPKKVQDKITNLMGFPANIPDTYHDENSQIEFYTLSAHARRLQAGTLEPVTLSFCAGLEAGETPAHDLRNEDVNPLIFDYVTQWNYANLLNSEIFILFSQYPFDHNDPELTDTHIYRRNQINPTNIIAESGTKFLLAPNYGKHELEDYITSAAGQSLVKNKPGLPALLTAFENKDIYLLPSYGYTLTTYSEAGYDFPDNLLQIIAGARYAQLHDHSNKGILIPFFYDLPPEEIQKILIAIHGGSRIGNLLLGISERNDAMRELGLAESFSITRLTDPDASSKIANLQNGKILLVATGQLPKLVFNSLYARNSSNILLQVREGAGTFSSLVQTRRPHIRCGFEWERGSIGMDDALARRLHKFQRAICAGQFQWAKLPLHKMIGEYIIDAQDANSDLSLYFKWLGDEAANPQNHRIVDGFEQAMPYINQLPPPPVKVTSIFISLAGRSASLLSRASNYIYESVNYVIDSTSNMICNTVGQCPSYFPKEHPSYWNAKNPHSLFNSATTNSHSQNTLPAPASAMNLLT